MKTSHRHIFNAARRTYAQAAAKPVTESLSAKVSKLKSGATLVTNDTEAPLVHLAIVYNAGSRYETSADIGSTAAIRVMAELSNSRMSTFMLTKNMIQLGSGLECSTGRETISFSASCLRENAFDVARFLSTAALGPGSKPYEITDNHYKMEFENLNRPKDVLVLDDLHKAAYRSGLGNSLYMNRAGMGGVSADSIRAYADKFFVPSNSVMVAMGLSHDEATHLAHTNMVMAHNAGTRASKPASQYYGGGELRTENRDQLVHAAVAVEGAGLNSKDLVPLAVLQHIMGTGGVVPYSVGSGRIARAGVAIAKNPFSATTLNMNYSDTGLFGFYLASQAQDSGPLLQTFFQEFSNVTKAGGVADKDLAAAKARAAATVLMNSEGTQTLAADLGIQTLTLGQVQDTAAIVQAIQAVSLADVQNVAKKVINGKPAMVANGDLADVPYLDQIM